MEPERIALSRRGPDRLKVLHEVERKQATQVEAGRRLDLTDRHIRRLLVQLHQRGRWRVGVRAAGTALERPSADAVRKLSPETPKASCGTTDSGIQGNTLPLTTGEGKRNLTPLSRSGQLSEAADVGVKERRARQKQSLKREILHAARDLFVTEGYENVSMRRVADRIEYSPTTIYLYFKDKSDLMYEICQETFAKLRKRLEAMREQDGDPLVMLRRGLRAYVEFGLDHPQHYKATFVMPHEHQDPKEAARHQSPDSEGMKTFAFLRSGVQEAADAGKLRGDVDDISRALWAGIHGITSLLIVHHDFPWGDKEKVIDLTIDSMLAGLKVESQ